MTAHIDPLQPSKVIINRDADFISREAWSPSELQALYPETDVLSHHLSPLSVAATKAYNLRFSLLTAPFETLQAKWLPAGIADADAPGSGTGALPGASVNVALVTWDSRDVNTSEGVVADLCKKTFWFRFTTSGQKRNFVVQRSPAHLATFISAVQYSFPHLFVPTEADVTIALATLVCEFFLRNADAMSSHLPALYFFLECQEKAAVAFFSTLDGVLKTRKAMEGALLESLRPKVSKRWFSWGKRSSKSKDAGAEDRDALADAITFLDQHSSTVPACVKPAYLLAVARRVQFAALADQARNLAESAAAETAAFETLAASVSVSPQTNAPVPGWLTGQPTELVAEAKQSAADMKRTAAFLQQLVFSAGSMKSQIGTPMFSALCLVADEAALLIVSLEQYLDSYLSAKRLVASNEPYVTGKKSPKTGSAAAGNPDMLRQVVDLHKSYVKLLTLWEKSIAIETEYANAWLRSLQRRMCSFVFAAVSTELDSFDERHHSQLLGMFGPTEGPALTSLMQLLERSSDPSQPCDIINV